MARPDLAAGLSPEAFRDHYWLKAELMAFCRAAGLSASGGKMEVADRIEAFLRDGTRLVPAKRPARIGAMPGTFTRATVIGEGWRCTQALRVFFEAETHPGFRFDAVARGFVHDGAGRTLGEAADAYMTARGRKREIAPQLEYNRFTRAYAEAHPGASRSEVAAAWKRHRDTPVSKR